MALPHTTASPSRPRRPSAEPKSTWDRPCLEAPRASEGSPLGALVLLGPKEVASQPERRKGAGLLALTSSQAEPDPLAHVRQLILFFPEPRASGSAGGTMFSSGADWLARSAKMVRAALALPLALEAGSDPGRFGRIGGEHSWSGRSKVCSLYPHSESRRLTTTAAPPQPARRDSASPCPCGVARSSVPQRFTG